MIPKLYHNLVSYLTTKTLKDEFIDWLTLANAGMLHRGNSYLMDYAIARLSSESPMVEIGSFCGLSTNVLAYLLQKHGKSNQLISCDKWEFEGAETGKTLGQSKITHRHYRSFVRDSFKRNVQFFAGDNQPRTIEAFSDEFFELWQNKAKKTDVFGRRVTLGGPISMAYVDGNHTYAYARRDFAHVDLYLEPQGFILFDDSADGAAFGVGKLMKEVLANSRYRLVMKNPNYLVQKLV